MVIENESILIRVDPLGAEWRSLFDKRTGTERLWQGDPAIWTGQAPVLFPVIGKQHRDAIRVGGVSYPHPKHGFFRKRLTTLIRHTSDELVFELASDDQTRVHYPFEFRLRVRFTIDGTTVRNSFDIENTGDAPLPFHLGAHPAFRIAIEDGESIENTSLVFEQPETASVYGVSPDGLLKPDAAPYLSDERSIPIGPDTFNPDALVFKSLRSNYLDIQSSYSYPFLRVSFEEFPYLGIWSKPGAPYVCVEPWIGCADTVGRMGEFREKEAVRWVDPGQTARVGYEVSLIRK